MLKAFLVSFSCTRCQCGTWSLIHWGSWERTFCLRKQFLLRGRSERKWHPLVSCEAPCLWGLSQGGCCYHKSTELGNFALIPKAETMKGSLGKECPCSLWVEYLPMNPVPASLIPSNNQSKAWPMQWSPAAKEKPLNKELDKDYVWTLCCLGTWHWLWFFLSCGSELDTEAI